ncbi:hypothetical protein PILCRDRAFT_816791 [Piloderma croceum F 1598]|uniref:Uncharacterized protein n=1 Tax=Piloderma croceum (strain F 1598) TaxID=765440 RepID=A0A0C3BH23_PILCF|nr:hypothetical protein PILCRDRAFT_816791 [Piloderma croceum F 1598]
MWYSRGLPLPHAPFKSVLFEKIESKRLSAVHVLPPSTHRIRCSNYQGIDEPVNKRWKNINVKPLRPYKIKGKGFGIQKPHEEEKRLASEITAEPPKKKNRRVMQEFRPYSEHRKAIRISGRKKNIFKTGWPKMDNCRCL